MKQVKANLINYFDVWGNEKDGWEVNNLCKECEITLNGLYTNKSVLIALKECGFIKKSVRLNQLVIEDLYPFIEISQKKDYMPVCRLEIIEE